MPHRVSALERRSRQFQYELPKQPDLVIKKPESLLKPKGVSTEKTAKAMNEAASKYGLNGEQLGIIIDIFGPDLYEEAVKAVSNMTQGEGKSFEEAIGEMQHLLQIEE